MSEDTNDNTIIASEGDSIPSIAHDHGHFFETIWNHGNNAALKALRKNPNILYPGDEVFVPALRLKTFSKGTDSRHSFVRRGTPQKLKIQLMQLGEPRKNEPYTLVIDGEIINGTTDGDGNLEQFIKPNAKGGVLKLQGGKEEYPVRIGHLNPIDTVSGQKQRLNNLGYNCGDESEDETEQFAQAITQFQGAKKLKETGKMDDATKAKLESLHT